MKILYRDTEHVIWTEHHKLYWKCSEWNVEVAGDTQHNRQLVFTELHHIKQEVNK